MCYVDDDLDGGYYALLNIPLLVYIALFVIVFFTHGRQVLALSNKKPDAPKVAEQAPLIEGKKSVEDLPFHLRYKLIEGYKLQCLYFVLFLGITSPNFIYSLGKYGLDIYNLFICLHPFVILIVMLRAMKVQA